MGRLIRRYIRAFKAKIVDALTVSGLLTLDKSGQALLIKPSADPTANTKLLEIQNAAAASKFSVDLEGDVIGNTATIGTKDISKAIIHTTAGKKIYTAQRSVTGTEDLDLSATFSAIDAGGVVASLAEDAALAGLWVTADKGGVAGHVDIKVWKATGAADCTPIAATVAKKVNIVVVGDPA